MILGGGECVWDDVKKLEAMIGMEWPHLIIAVNDIGCHWPRRIDHWCTLHPEKLPGWMEARKKAGLPDGYTTWTRENRTRRTRSGDILTTHMKVSAQSKLQGGASGMLAVAIALDELGSSKVVLCGVPMNRTPHFKESKNHKPGQIWPGAQSHFRAWTKDPVKGRLMGRVCSMSGETKKLLGDCVPCDFIDCQKAA